MGSNLLTMKQILLLTCLLVWGLMSAQFNQDAPWMQNIPENVNASEPTFQEIQQAFNQYWETHDPNVKGSGYKPFKRWEYIWENEVDENGYLPTAADQWNAWQNIVASQSQNNAVQTDLSNWQPLGPVSHTNTGSWSSGQARINAIIVDPNNSSTWYIGTPAGGLWKSTNSGNTWTTLTDNLPQIGVSGIAIDFSDSNTIYIATGDDDAGDTQSAGVFKSTDGGLTWNQTGLNPSNTPSSMNDIYINPSNSNMLWVATNQGVYRTTDGGANWTNVLSGNIKDIKLKPSDPSTLYAVTPNTFYKSTNSGASFPSTASGLPGGSGRLVIDITPANANYVYVLAVDTGYAYQGVYRSTNSGNSFTARNTGGPMGGCSQGWYDLAFGVSTTDANQVYIGCLNVWRSTNGASSFTEINSWSNPSGPRYTHADIHMIRSFGGDIYVCSDGGIYRSTNNGNNFSDFTAGIQASQFYKIAVSPSDVNKMMGGLQDNGGHAYNNGNGNWKNYYGADGMDTAIDPTNDNKYYGFIQNGGGLYKSTNAGNSSSGSVGQPSGSTGNWVTPLAIDSNGDLYAGYNRLYRLNGAENGWIALANLGSPADQIEIAPSDNTRMYIAVDDVLKRSTDSGSSVTDVETFGENIKGIAVHATNPDIVWVTTSNSVNKSIDAGNTFTNITGNLPTSDQYMFLNDIVHQAGQSQNPIFVATSLGVYRTVDGGSWELFSNNLPNTIVTDLEINIADQSITAATYGRGIWRSSIPFCTTLTADQELAVDGGTYQVASSTGLCTGQTIAFRPSATTGSSPSYSWTGPNGFTSSSQVVTLSGLTMADAGTYTVTITAGGTCGSGDYEFVLDLEEALQPSTQDITICNNDAASLIASGSTDYKWYNVASGGTAIATGNAYTTPALTANTTYYVSGTSAIIVSEAAPSPGINTAQNYDTPQGLVFNTNDDIILESFTMSAVSNGNRIISVTDNSGNTIASATVPIPAGESLVTVNFDIPKGDGYTLRIPSGTVDMRRTPTGNGVSFPYNSPSNVISITGNTVNDPNYYYFFYDWNFTSKGGRCESNRTPINILVNNDNPDLSDGDTTYTIDSAAATSFNNGDTIVVNEGLDLALALPTSAFSGTLLWTAPNGDTFTTNTVTLPSIVDGGPYEGNWTVAITFTPNCGASPQVVNFTVDVDLALSIDDNEFENLNIYPNPTSDLLTITSSNTLDNVRISIVDISGRRLQDNLDPVRISSNQLRIDVSTLASGTYFIILNDEQNKSVKTIIKN